MGAAFTNLSLLYHLFCFDVFEFTFILSFIYVILGFKWGYYLVLSSFAHCYRYQLGRRNGKVVGGKSRGDRHREMAAGFRIVYFCQVLFCHFSVWRFTFFWR